MGSAEQIRQSNGRLDSWKAIAQYLGRDVRSVQRWERERGLPVYRVPGQRGGAVFAYEHELEEWLRSRSGQVPAEAQRAFMEEAASPSLGVSDEALPSQPSQNHWLRNLAFALAILFLLFGLAMIWRRSVLEAAAAQPIRSIAVLPLQSLSSDPNQEYFADGMTDELITDLAQVKELKVVSKTSIMQYKGTRKALPQIGHELNVDAVVEGSVLRSGNRVRITAQLIRTATDRHLWAQSYDGDLQNLLSLQARVAEAITDEVRLSLSADERTRLRMATRYNPEAYDLYLRGRYAFSRRNEPSFHEAIGYFQQAAAKDPSFALAYSGLSDCDTLLALFGEGYAWVPQAVANARKAVSLDEGLAEAHTSLAAAEVLDWRWAEAEKEFHRALELNPNNAQAHQWYGNLLLGPQGRHGEAISELQRAVELDPLSLVMNNDLGYAYFLAGQYDSAFQQYQKVLAMDSTFLPVHFDLMLYYQQRGMYDKEIDELIADRALAGDGDSAHTIRRLATKPRRLFEAMASTGGTFDKRHIADEPAVAAGAYALLGKKREALAALQRSYERRDPSMLYLRTDPSLTSLRNEPEFLDLQRNVGLISQ